VRLRSLTAGLGAAFALAMPAAALAAAPPNDAPTAPGEFRMVTAENGRPSEREAIAELAEATADPGVPRCLGEGSFERTVFFRVPEADLARELRVEASGRTTAVADLAAFVQPRGATVEQPSLAEPNACGGAGAGGADASEEPTAGVGLRVPAGHAVLIEVGRRGAPGNPDDERALLSLASRDLPDTPAPAGDRGDGGAPQIAEGETQTLPFGGATLTEEDPAQPPCPSLGSVWRRFVPAQSGSRNVTAGGEQAGTLTVFSGERPTGENVVNCVNRERRAGELALSIPVQAGVPLWVRVGTDRPAGDATGSLRISAGPPVDDGGSGGGDPALTQPGAVMQAPPAAKAPPAKAPTPTSSSSRGCRAPSRTSLARQRIAFTRMNSRSRRQNTYRTFPIALGRVRVALCGARVRLVGPRGKTYASGTIRKVSGRRPRFRLKRVRRFVRGTYRLKITALAAPGNRRVTLRTRGRARFR